MPIWIKCECCDDFICTLHHLHVHDCECPDIDTWAELDIDPYTMSPHMEGESVWD